MRWFWIDRFVEFESGRRATAIKNISLVEEQMDEYLPGCPVMPASLIVEGLAQTGGILVGEHNQFRERVVLAKVARATFHQPAVPGDTLRYTVTADDIRDTGAICHGTSHCDDRLQAEVELVFAHLDDRFQGVDLFQPTDLLRTLRVWRVFEVGRDAKGRPLTIPPHLLDAEVADRPPAAPAAEPTRLR